MQVGWCPLGWCNQQLLITSINMNEEKEAKSKNTNGLRISLPRALHHFVFTSLQQGLCLYKLSHMAVSPSLPSCMSQHPPTFPLGSQHHLRPAALISWRQDTGAWETKPCLLPVVQAEAGTHLWRGCGPAGGCHNLPKLWLFARPLQVLNMGLLWGAARTCPVLAKWGACFWACLWSKL